MKERMKRTAIALILMPALLTGCSLDDDGIKELEPEPEVEPVISLVDNMELTPAELELVNNSNEFALNLFRQITDPAVDEGMKSHIVSPLSITYALGMLNNGAAGNTQAQINEALGFSDTGADSINAFCYKMIKTAPVLDSLTKVMISNTIYMNQGFNLNPDFVRKANYYYDAYPQTRDFHDPQTLTEINQWASDHTEHMIEKVLDNDFNENAVSYLLNAIYFKGSWTYKFDKSRTKVEDFIFPDETDELLSCNMMQMHSDIDYAVTDQYQAVSLPYGNGSFQMTVLLHKIQQTDPQLPIVELDLRPKVPTLEQWQELNRNMSQCEVMLKLPRFETESKTDLIEIMKRLGVTDAFYAEDADFSNFCDVPTYIGLMKQVAKIKLDEEGTEAAAVTVIGVDWTSAPPSYISFIANRPFIYVISEKKTGAIFFIGQYTGH